MQDERAKILIVDDVHENLVALDAVLDSLGQIIRWAKSGREALKLLLEEEFAVILMDVQMPEMDGFEAAKLIRGRQRFRHTPIIFITAMYTTEMHASLGYNLGAVDYIYKPYPPEVLRAKVSVFVDLHQKNEQLRRQAELIAKIQKNEIEEKLRLMELETELLFRRSNQLQESNRLKSEFLANMSHEIRTPMNGIVGMAELLLYSDLNTEQREMAGVIKESARALLVVINDVLDLSKIEAGKLQLDLADFDFELLIKRVVELFTDEAKEKHLRIRAEIADDVPRMLRGDSLRVRQVLLNLLSNAVKFTDNGDIIIRAVLTQCAVAHCHVLITVTDTGIGIANDRLSVLFDPFTQGDSSTTRKYGGTGLGLSICKRLVGLMGGEISALSELDKGSVFSFMIPFEFAELDQTESASELPSGQKSLQGLNFGPGQSKLVLLAEDSPTNQRVTVLQLNKLGLDLHVAENGMEAVRAATENSYSLIFMDCQMPAMDGFEATAAIRQNESPLGRHTPIIGLTAQAMEGDRERCLASGMDDYLSKPSTMENLRQIVDKWLWKAPLSGE